MSASPLRPNAIPPGGILPDHSEELVFAGRAQCRSGRRNVRGGRIRPGLLHGAAGRRIGGKAWHRHHKQDAWGNGDRQLLESLPPTATTSRSILNCAQVPDNFLIPTRYPSGHESGAPMDHYGPGQSAEAIDSARQVIEFRRLQLP